MTKKQLQKENEELRYEIEILQEKSAYWREKAEKYYDAITQYMQSRQDIYNQLIQAANALRQEYIKEGEVNAATEERGHKGA